MFLRREREREREREGRKRQRHADLTTASSKSIETTMVVFSAAGERVGVPVRERRGCFYALPDGALPAAGVPGDAQLHGRAPQVPAREPATGRCTLLSISL